MVLQTFMYAICVQTTKHFLRVGMRKNKIKKITALVRVIFLFLKEVVLYTPVVHIIVY
jgi:hypothetical protein